MAKLSLFHNLRLNRQYSLLLDACVLILLVAACSPASPNVFRAAPTSPTSLTQATPLPSTGDNPTVQPSPAAAVQPTLVSTTISGQVNTSDATVQCTAPAALTPAQTEGPFFKPGSPERSSLLETGMPGEPLTLSGYVLTTSCQPVDHALLDFWQADSNGQYDNSGYTLRGHVFTDQNGYYRIETIVPGEYPGRTEHIHVKVQAPGGALLTTQLYFPGVQRNQSDTIFSPQLLLNLENGAQGLQATFNFIVSTPG
jgi:protocatechuate 3,4-dioxygenase beta subunit